MATDRRLLLLGGTTEASALARRLAGRRGLSVVTSLAGRTSRPAAPAGGLRVGGFGGPAGLARYLRDESVDVVVDATHPFAAVMRWNAAEACADAGVPRLRLERPGWEPGPADRWTPVASLEEAARKVAASGAERVFLTTGRTGLDAFAPASDGRRWWLVRCIEPPAPMPLAPAEVILERGPFRLDGETAIMQRHRVDLVVTKNSGGTAAAPKLEAARSLGVRVLMVDRPPSPPGPAASNVEEAAAWVAAQVGGEGAGW